MVIIGSKRVLVVWVNKMVGRGLKLSVVMLIFIIMMINYIVLKFLFCILLESFSVFVIV